MRTPPIPHRFRRPKARLRLEPLRSDAFHPELVEGCLIRLQITLLPIEPFRVRSGHLELALLTTHFAPTVLDGYHEHTSEKLRQTIPLCENAAANPGDALLYYAELRLPPDAPPPDSRPTRRQWQARARFAVNGYRDLWTVHLLRDISPPQGGPPIVDGRGFLPL